MKQQNNESNPEKLKDSLPQKFKSLVDTVIQPEERTLRNYVNINFWRTKYDEYKKFAKKKKRTLMYMKHFHTVHAQLLNTIY
ncbi:MAG: hypothetical protein WHV26_06445 [Spirochaetota bacterium]